MCLGFGLASPLSCSCVVSPSCALWSSVLSSSGPFSLVVGRVGGLVRGVCPRAQNHREPLKFQFSSDSNAVECATRLVYRTVRPDGRRTVPAEPAEGGDAGSCRMSFVIAKLSGRAMLPQCSGEAFPEHCADSFGRNALPSVVASSSQESSLAFEGSCRCI